MKDKARGEQPKKLTTLKTFKQVKGFGATLRKYVKLPLANQAAADSNCWCSL